MTHTPPDEIAARGVTQVPGGQGVFPSLTVAENLRLAGWLATPTARRAVTEATEQRPGVVPQSCETVCTSRRATCPAASSRCSRWAWRSSAKPPAADDRRAVARPGADRRRAAARRSCRRSSDRGTTIILVEQSVNVALTRGRDRRTSWRRARSASTAPPPSCSSGPTCSGRCSSRVRSIGATSLAAGAERRRHGRGRPRPADGHRRQRPTGARGATASRSGFGGSRRSNDVSLQRAGGRRSSASSAPTAPARRPCSTSSPASSPTTAAPSSSTDRGATTWRAGRRSPRPARTGPLVPGRTTVPRPHRGGDHRGRARERTSRCATRWPRRCTSRTSIVSEAGVYAPGSTSSSRSVGLSAFRDKFVRELSTGSRRIVDLACVLAHEPTVLLLDEPSSGIAQREAEALGSAAASAIRDTTRRDACSSSNTTSRS